MVSLINQQYPHCLYVREDAPSTRAENGDIIPGTSRYVLLGYCREETNGKGEEIQTADKRSYKFHSLVQCPVWTARVPEGTETIVTMRPLQPGEMTEESVKELTRLGVVRIQGTCAKCDVGRLHTRIWL